MNKEVYFNVTRLEELKNQGVSCVDRKKCPEFLFCLFKDGPDPEELLSETILEIKRHPRQSSS